AIAAAGVPYLIFRTSWLYGMRGKNFLLTMMRLAAEREELRIVADQHGAPTWCRTLADTTACILAQARVASVSDSAAWWRENSGLYHLTSRGETTWHGFADALLDQAEKKPKLVPISSTEYPVPAARPNNSRLSCELLMNRFGHLPHWREALLLCQEL
ncbi:MAG: dTDP-4-dehydrorhamnose reductase, partial [Oxalobacteraceae bacterium]